MTTTPAPKGADIDIEQFRAGFEAWARDKDMDIIRATWREGYGDINTDIAWDSWVHAKRESSTEPSSTSTSLGAAPGDALDAARLDWSDPTPPNADCPYDYVTAQTPFGPIRITWKSWKNHDARCVDVHPVPDFFYAGNNLDDAKKAAESKYFAAIAASTALEKGE